MKNLVCLLVISSVMLFSCSGKMLTDENVALEEAKIPILMKMGMCAVTGSGVFDFHVENNPVINSFTGKVIVPDLYVASEFLVSCYGINFGELQGQGSMTVESASLGLNALFTGHRVVLIFVCDGRLFAANGDYCNVICHIRIDRTDPSRRVITGDTEFPDSIGKYDGEPATA